MRENKGRKFSTSMTLTEGEYCQVRALKKKGETIVSIFRYGLMLKMEEHGRPEPKAEVIDDPVVPAAGINKDPLVIEDRGTDPVDVVVEERYGCGCPKVKDKFICDFHGRI